MLGAINLLGTEHKHRNYQITSCGSADNFCCRGITSSRTLYLESEGYLTCYLSALRCLESNYLPTAIFRVYNVVLLRPRLGRDVSNLSLLYSRNAYVRDNQPVALCSYSAVSHQWKPRYHNSIQSFWLSLACDLQRPIASCGFANPVFLVSAVFHLYTVLTTAVFGFTY
jgi:hypothetical protein